VPFALPFVVILGCALVVHEIAVDVGISRPAVFTVLLVLVFWTPVELLLAVFLRDHRTLHVVDQSKKAQ